VSEAEIKVYLVGYSGHAYVVADAARAIGVHINGYVQKERADDNPFDIPYAGFERDSTIKVWQEESVFILGIGDNDIREKVAELLRSKEKRCLKLVHPGASVSHFTSIGAGTFVARGVLVNPMSYIGENVILNTGSVVEHDCRIGDGSHIAPRAVLAGNVSTGKKVFIGANAVVKQGVRIGSGAIVGAGAVVLRNIGPNEIWAGNPAKLISSEK
jgi:sugar O-acyltransferase (sialic acid O-acetyltransferase NeuD family)